MMARPYSPLHSDAERSAIWDMLVTRDISAFVAADWSLVADDFIAEGFLGIQAGKDRNPDRWSLGFPNLESYRAEWLRQAKASANTVYAEDLETALHRVTKLHQIDINGDTALAHKLFDGVIQLPNRTHEVLDWQTLYICRKVLGRWKIAGFIGYMPRF